MPDSAAKKSATPAPSDRPPRTRKRDADTPVTPSGTDTETSLARAARSAQRLAQLSHAQREGVTLDLFAQETERAAFQAMNTDIRQGTLAGFELPEAFMAAVQAGRIPAMAVADPPPPTRRAAPPDDDDRQASLPTGHDAQDIEAAGDGAKPAKPSAMAASATRQASATLRAASARMPLSDAVPGDGTNALSPEASDARRASASLAPASIEDDHPARAASACASAPDGAWGAPVRGDAAPELDRARAAAFADTVEALRAVIAEQRNGASAPSRRTKTMLAIIVAMTLLTVATGVAQSMLLMRTSRASAVQQKRMEQLLLNQQATLASLFDTDSANVSMAIGPGSQRRIDEASPIQPVGAVKSDAGSNRHAARHAHRSSGTAALH
jgi:hypothetical protein